MHATCVAHAGSAVLITGPSGSGKSALALQLIALGGKLVADDRTVLTCERGRVIARCPAPLAGIIEARGVGILNAPTVSECPVALVVDLETVETDRLPPQRETTIMGQSVPLLHRVDQGHFPAAIFLHLASGRRA
ncbi:HPr kinase/phosphatase C-terminal domain-containing protein [Pelagimonas sp. KU-00592-HH]